jgi:hypothetical protein
MEESFFYKPVVILASVSHKQGANRLSTTRVDIQEGLFADIAQRITFSQDLIRIIPFFIIIITFFVLCLFNFQVI